MLIRFLLMDEHKGPTPTIPVFLCGEGQTDFPPLNHEQAKALARIILMDEAKRPAPTPRHGHPKAPMQGHFVSYSGKCEWRRGKDRVERIYASVELLRSAGASEKEACLEVAEVLGARIGYSRRGRPPKAQLPDDILRRKEVIRKLWDDFKGRHPWREKLPAHDSVVEMWFAHAIGIAQWAGSMARTDVNFLQGHRNIEELVSLARNILPLAERLHGLTYLNSDLPIGWKPSGLVQFVRQNQQSQQET